MKWVDRLQNYTIDVVRFAYKDVEIIIFMRENRQR